MSILSALFSRRSKRKAVVSTPFSEFIRHASSAEKKRVYTEVLKAATERQNAVVRIQPVPQK